MCAVGVFPTDICNERPAVTLVKRGVLGNEVKCVDATIQHVLFCRGKELPRYAFSSELGFNPQIADVRRQIRAIVIVVNAHTYSADDTVFLYDNIVLRQVVRECRAMGYVGSKLINRVISMRRKESRCTLRPFGVLAQKENRIVLTKWHLRHYF